MPEPTKAQLAAQVRALEKALKRETTARERAEQQLAESDRVRAEALEQQRATSEILRVISSSPTDVQPVFDAIVKSARVLLRAAGAVVFRRVDDEIHLAALTTDRPSSERELTAGYPVPVSRMIGDNPLATSVWLHGEIESLSDAASDPRWPERLRGPVIALGVHGLLMVPMRRDGLVVGLITVMRREAGPFAEAEISLLQTFADQAVIAIENVRLFSELQTSNRELTTALDTQTATSDILRVISRSQTDLQPVFDTILASATRLLGAYAGLLTRRAGEQIEIAALTSTDEAGDAALRAAFPHSRHSEGGHAQVIRDRAPLNVADAWIDLRVPEAVRAAARARGNQSLVIVPLLRLDEAVGAIGVTRRDPGGFTDDEIALLETFADQAVIAIENARLLTELQDKNAALTKAHAEVTEALEQQTATSEILRVISSSPTDAQPVFDTIVRSSDRLLGGLAGSLALRIGDEVHLVALTPTNPEGDAVLRRLYPMPIGDNGGHAEVVRLCRSIMVTDTEVELTGRIREFARIRGFRSRLSVPLIRDGIAIGSLGVTRAAPGAFTDREIALLKTFAAQAVIAIENVRLFTELQQRTQDLTRSVGQLTALSEVSRALSSTLDLQAVLTTIVSRAVQLSDGSGGVVYEHEPATRRWALRATHNIDAEVMDLQQSEPIRPGEGAVGRAVAERSPVQIGDLRETSHYAARVRVRDLLIARGYLSVLAVPLLVEDDILGALVILRREAGELAPQTVELMKTFATQSALAIQNARLFRELEIKSRELEVASQHKSEFLASMSHELRTPLNAIIGFSDVLLQGMFGDTNEKQTEYLRDILVSGQHLLSLINDILDLSKIEAGRMDLDLAEFDLPSAIDDALLLMRERAGRRGITLERQVDERLGEIRADQRKVKQVLLNLLSNAVKFTPEGGRIDVRAAPVNGSVEISVTDTGIGIAPEDYEAVFEEFKQVGKAEKKAEGTGLGLALCRKFVELHGGRIWVKSQLGAGSTFTFSLPMTQ